VRLPIDGAGVALQQWHERPVAALSKETSAACLKIRHAGDAWPWGLLRARLRCTLSNRRRYIRNGGCSAWPPWWRATVDGKPADMLNFTIGCYKLSKPSPKMTRSPTNHDCENATSRRHPIRTGLKTQPAVSPFPPIRNASMPAGG
jgi:hypothetical protein